MSPPGRPVSIPAELIARCDPRREVAGFAFVLTFECVSRAMVPLHLLRGVAMIAGDDVPAGTPNLDPDRDVPAGTRSRSST